MSDQEVQVKFSADVSSLLSGMKDAQDSISEATEGMKGNLGSLVESFEKLGVGALALGAVGLAFEGLKEGVSTIKEAVHSTDELARSFETLHMRTGASYEDLTVYKNAMVLSGGSMEDFSAILTGLSRKMAATPEIYVANKIAANEAALSHQDLMTTLAKSVQVIASIEDPGRRSEMAISLLGGRAQAMLPQIMRMNEVIEKDGVEGLKRYGATINDQAIEKMKALEHATGMVKLQIESVDQKMAESGRGFATWGKLVELGFKTALEWVTRSGGPLDVMSGFTLSQMHMGEGSAGLTSKEGGAPEFHPEAGKVGQTQKELEAQKAAAAKAAEEKIQLAELALQAQIKCDQEMVASGAMSFEEMIEDERKAYEERFNLGKKSVVDKATLDNQILSLDLEASAHQRKLDEEAQAAKDKAAKESLKIQAVATQAEVDLQKYLLDQTDKMLDEQLARGEITAKQYLQKKTEAILAGLEIDEEAIAQEQQAALQAGNIAEYDKLQEKKVQATRRALGQIEALEKQQQQQQLNDWNRVIDSFTANWASGIDKILHHQMRLKDGMKQAMQEIMHQSEMMFIQMGLDAAKHAITSMALAEAQHAKQNGLDAKGAAGAAFKSTAEIPIVGPILAPLAAAAAFTSVVAFAEGGWDRVPSDQLAYLHKEEMVLPRSIAEPVRQMAASGAAGGQAVHIHATDAQSVQRLFAKHQGSLASVMKEAVRNGRVR